jgi:GH24 family phage-related lysozyme (muramidase)
MIDLEFTAGFIAGFEGFVDHVYLDAVGVETVGYGETRGDVIERYRGAKITQRDALNLLKRRVQEFADGVEAGITNRGALTPQRHAAFTSLAYNIGLGGFAKSTACARFNAGDLDGACQAIAMWNKGGGRVLEGLARRRAAEMALFQGGAARDPSPPAEPTSKPSSSSLLREGGSGPPVRDIQNRLGAFGLLLTIDGAFGPRTAEAVRAFQKTRGLAADGVVGPGTLAAMRPPTPGRLLCNGIAGDDVRGAQDRLCAWGWALALDGLFGTKTDSAVKGFQQGAGLDADGMVGPATWAAMWNLARPPD